MLGSRRWGLMTSLAAAMFFCYLHRGTLSVAAPFLMKELDLGPATMGILLSAFFWSYSLMQIPAGWVVDRFGVKAGYAAGFALWSAAAVGTGLVGGLVGLIVARMVLGVGQAVAFPASARAVSNWFDKKERGTVTAIYLSSVRLGQAAVVAAGAFLLPLYGWRIFFVMMGLAGLVWLLHWMLTPPPSGGSVEQSRMSGAQVLAMFRQRTVLGVALGFFAYDYIWFLFLTWMPGYLSLERNFTPYEMGIYSSLPFLGMTVVIMLAGITSDWLIRRGYHEIRVRKGFIATGFLISLSIIPVGLVESNMLAVALLTASLWGLGLIAPNTWTLTQAVCERRVVGTASGIQNFGGNLSGVVAPALTGFIVQWTGSFALAFWVAGGVAIAGIFFYLVLIPTAGRMRSEPAAAPVTAASR
jgi:MFS transporter, ACS family, D-galactonate transporter